MRAKPKITRAAEELLQRINHEVAYLPEKAIKNLIPALVFAEKELTADLKTYLMSVGADTRFTAQQYRRALVQIRGGLNAIENLRPELVDVLREAGKGASAMATRHLLEELSFFHHKFSKSLNPIALPEASKVAEKLVLERFVASANKYAQDVQQRIKRQLAVSMLRGETIDQMTNRLMGAGMKMLRDKAPVEKAEVVGAKLFDNDSHKARRLIRTEVINAYNEYAEDQLKQYAKEYNIPLKVMWCAVNDRRVCVDCAALDGRVFKMDVGERPPLHPNCFVPETIIQGDFVGASKALYTGEIITIYTASGRRISVTPNHPIVTSTGLLSAKHLKKGIDLVIYSRGDEFFSSIQLNKYNEPSPILKVFETFGGQFNPFSSPTAATDFHGDASGFKGNIDIIDPFRELNFTFFELRNKFGKFPFIETYADLFSISGLRSFKLCGFENDSISSGQMCISSLIDTLFNGHLRPLKPLGFGLIPNFNTFLYKGMSENITTNTGFVRELFERFSGLVSFDKIIDIGYQNYFGHVYDLQSVQGHMLADNIFVSNCRCTITPYLEEWE